MALDGDIKFSDFPGSCQIERSLERTLFYAMNFDTARLPITAKKSRISPTTEYKPLSVTCQIDRAAPEVWNYLCTGKKIEEIVVRLWRNDDEGVQINYLSFTLHNARAVGCEFLQLHNQQTNGIEAATDAMVEYQFSFEEIIVTYDDGSGVVEASNSWITSRSRGRS